MDRERILRAAGHWLNEPVQTITGSPAPGSAGGSHDYVSGAGQFQDHRRLLVRMSEAVSALAAAYRLERQEQYAQAATQHLLAWFVAPATRMSPNLDFAQGVHSGPAGISDGVTDTLQLVEVARSIAVLRDTLMPRQWTPLLAWFHYYLGWLKASEAGRAARNAADAHGTAWSLQVAEFARLLADEPTRGEVRDLFLTVQLPSQAAPTDRSSQERASDSSLDDSVRDFNRMSALAWSLGSVDAKRIGYGAPAGAAGIEGAADPGALLRYRLPTGQSVCQAAANLAADLAKGTASPPRPVGLLFCGLACSSTEYIGLWKGMPPGSSEAEVVRQPLLWV